MCNSVMRFECDFWVEEYLHLKILIDESIDSLAFFNHSCFRAVFLTNE